MKDRKQRVLSLLLLLTPWVAVTANEDTPAQVPLFTVPSASPVMMINMSNDHQLYFKAYDDFSDLSGDGQPDTTYNHNFDYFGYFDSYKCYTYNTTNNNFEPVAVTNDKYCSGNRWSGNFLNWGTMTRMDIVRQILYGGLRSTDTEKETVLERSYLPNDAHSFAKYYNGEDLDKLTPFSNSGPGTTTLNQSLTLPTPDRNNSNSRVTLETAWRSNIRVQEGDQITVQASSTSKNLVMQGVVRSFNNSNGQISLQVTGAQGVGQAYDFWEVINHSRQGLTLCNTTQTNTRWSHNVNDPPLMRVAQGDYSLWNSNERWQCKWHEERKGLGHNDMRVGGKNFSNGNDHAASGLFANAENPRKAHIGLGQKDYEVRVQACVPSLLGQENCKSYTEGNYKPIGLLQEYGENDAILFGLLTGSYAKNKSGGVLRRNTGSITSEINTDGTFKKVNDSIIHTLDRLRISRYDHNNGLYTGDDKCDFNISGFKDGECSNWGNPQAEIYLEALRYLAGKEAPTSAFNADDKSRIPARGGNLALEPVTWQESQKRSLECSPLNILQFNASTISYDGDQLNNDLGIDAQKWTNKVGADEGIHGGDYIIGQTPTSGSDLRVCTAKNISALGGVDGLCPESPRLEGTYNLAGLARFAREEGLPGGPEGEQRSVRTFGVALAPGVPAINIPTIQGDHEVTLMPACLNTRRSDMVQNCAIVDFKIAELDLESTPRRGRLFVNWEIAEQGGDFDSDMWGMLDFEMDANEIRVTTNVIAQSVGAPMGFGFTISGTTQDGFYTPSGINNHPGNNHKGFGCNNCNITDAAITTTFQLSSGSAELLEPPLFLAAKWGGYRRLDGSGNPVGYDDAYFAVTNPSELAASLAQVFEQAATGRGTAVNLASDGPGTLSDRLIYQTRFFSENWSGELLAYSMRAGGDFSSQPLWRASQKLPLPEDRRLFTQQKGEGKKFNTSLPPSVFALTEQSERDQLVGYLRGDTSQEERNDGNLRDREHLNLQGQANLLGSLVHSRPLYVSSRADFGHRLSRVLPKEQKSSYAAYRLKNQSRPSVVYVGSNAGKLHAFDATTGEELFAYIPETLLPYLKKLKDPAYPENHRFFVDGQMQVMDIHDGQDWRRLLVASLGAGGRALFALDVTNPASFGEEQVLWEVTSDDISELGYVLGQLTLAYIAGGNPNKSGWSVILGNGYASDEREASLLILNALTGKLETSIKVPGSRNGLSAPFVADLSRQGAAEVAYAGDLHGNLWRFDLNERSAERLYKVNTEQQRQRPITIQPLVTRHPQGGYAIHFATGRYFSEQDPIAEIEPQRFVTLREAALDLGNDLIEQTLTNETVEGVAVRSLTRKEVPKTALGCFFDLPDPGERVVAPLHIDSGQMLMTTLIPEPGACSVGARSFLHNFDPYTCGRSDYSAYSDLLIANPDAALPGSDEDWPLKVPVSGVESRLGKSTGSISQGDVLLFSGLQPTEDGSGVDDTGRLQNRSRINEPGYRIWHRCQPEEGDDC